MLRAMLQSPGNFRMDPTNCKCSSIHTQVVKIRPLWLRDSSSMSPQEASSLLKKGNLRWEESFLGSCSRFKNCSIFILGQHFIV